MSKESVVFRETSSTEQLQEVELMHDDYYTKHVAKHVNASSSLLEAICMNPNYSDVVLMNAFHNQNLSAESILRIFDSLPKVYRERENLGVFLNKVRGWVLQNQNIPSELLTDFWLKSDAQGVLEMVLSHGNLDHEAVDTIIHSLLSDYQPMGKLSNKLIIFAQSNVILTGQQMEKIIPLLEYQGKDPMFHGVVSVLAKRNDIFTSQNVVQKLIANSNKRDIPLVFIRLRKNECVDYDFLLQESVFDLLSSTQRSSLLKDLDKLVDVRPSLINDLFNNRLLTLERQLPGSLGDFLLGNECTRLYQSLQALGLQDKMKSMVEPNDVCMPKASRPTRRM